MVHVSRERYTYIDAYIYTHIYIYMLMYIYAYTPVCIHVRVYSVPVLWYAHAWSICLVLRLWDLGSGTYVLLLAEIVSGLGA